MECRTYGSSRINILRLDKIVLISVGSVLIDRVSPSSQPHRPCHYIPFLKNRHFVGRDPTLAALRQTFFETNCRTVALVGLGGTGKTQIALQFAYWVKENRSAYSVFWLPVLSKGTFEQGYAEIATKLPLQKGQDDEDPRGTARRYLSSEKAGPWLLVVDNADDKKMLLGDPDTPGLCEHLPQSDAGLVLFTTRSGEVAHSVSERVIELDGMD